MTSGQDLLSALFVANVDRVYGFLLARCGSPSLAEDLTGQTFEDAARAFARGAGSTVGPSWLLTVGRRRLIDHWRRDERLRNKMDILRSERLTDELSAEEIGGTGTDERVLRSLMSLPIRQRAALTLRYLDEYSVGEVAEAIGVPYTTAESLLARARRSFKLAYAAAEGEQQ